MDDEEDFDYDDENSAHYIVLMTCTFVVIAIVGLIGNVLILLTVLLNASMRTAPNVLLTNLAVGDLLIIVFWLPNQFSKTIHGHENALSHSSMFMCIASESCQVISQSVSALTLTVLSLDRYVVITSTTGRLVSSLLKFYVYVVILIWLLGISFAIPIVQFAEYYHLFDVINTSYLTEEDFEIHADSYICDRMPPSAMSSIIYESLRVALLYCIPVLIIGTSYSMMARKLIASLKNVRRLSSRTTSRSQQTKTRKRLAIAVLVIAIMFALCWLPEMVFNIMRSIDSARVFVLNNNAVQEFGPLLVYINCCANPIALGFTSLTFRRHFKRYLLLEFLRGTRIDESGSEYRFVSQTFRMKHVNKHTGIESMESTEVDKA
ncbi:neuromedin-B receptor-like [Antedon mediterranea]|uniref:neuromedin-B receptor-like n=1 Tax=Antedon mediterranea TaxID=105859 RepID=UPI003AF6F099